MKFSFAISFAMTGLMGGLCISGQSAPASAPVPASAPAAVSAPAEKSQGSSLTSPGSYKDWNDGLIDWLEIKDRFQLADYAGARLLPVEATETALPDKDADTYKDAVEMMGLAQRYLIYGMKKKLKSIPVTAAPLSPAPTPDDAASSPASAPEATPAVPPFLLLRIRVVKVKPGSPVHNYGGGIILAMITSYSKSSVKLEGELLDGGSGKELLSFSLTRTSRDSDTRLDMMVDDFTDAGADLGKMLTFFK